MNGGTVPIDLLEVTGMAEILQIKEKFVIDNAVKADWALEKIREHKKNYSRIRNTPRCAHCRVSKTH